MGRIRRVAACVGLIASSLTAVGATTAEATNENAVDDYVTVVADASVNVNVLANDALGMGGSGFPQSPARVTALSGTTSAGGTFTCTNGDARCKYNAPLGYVGPDSFVYRIGFRFGSRPPYTWLATDQANVFVTVVANQAPVAVDDVFDVRGWGENVWYVVENDTDPNLGVLGERLTVVPSAGASVAGGTVACGTGTDLQDCVYTAPSGFLGSDSFDYTVVDHAGESDVGTVTLTVTANLPPVANDDPGLSGYVWYANGVASSLALDLLGNDTDPDDAFLRLDTALVTTTAGGTFAPRCCGDPSLYTPPLGFVGTDTFTYTVHDGHGGSDTALATVEVLLDHPAVAATDHATVRGAHPITIDVRANDTDDLEPTYNFLMAQSTTSAGGGTVVCGSGNGPDAVCTYQAAAGFVGLDTFPYTISDGHQSSVGTVEVEVTANGSPTIVSTVVSVYIHEPEKPYGAFGMVVSDPESDAVVFPASVITSALGASLSCNNFPGYDVDGVPFPPRCAYYPADPTFRGQDSVTLVAVDDRGGSSAPATLTIDVRDDLAIVAPDIDASTAVDTPVDIDFHPIDEEYELDGGGVGPLSPQTAAGGSLFCTSSSNHVARRAWCTYTPPAGYTGVDTFQYQAADRWSTDTGTVTIIVGDVDTTDPIVSIVAPRPSGRYAAGEHVLARFSCTDDVAIVECTGLSTASPSPVADGGILDTSAVGTFTFTVTARDAAGNVASSAVTYDVSAPSVAGTIVDELGAPVAGMNVQLMNFPFGSSFSTISGPDGTYRFPTGAVSASISVVQAYAPASRPDLRLSNGGQVVRTGAQPYVVDLVVPFRDVDGIADAIENAAPNAGDGNADGTQDSAQAHVVSLPNIVDGRYVTLRSPVGVRFSATQSLNASPDGFSAPVGAISFDLLVRTPGDVASVTVLLPAGLDISDYRAVGLPDSLPDLTVVGRTVTFTLADGGTFDLDGQVNGSIRHLGVPVVPATADADGDGIDDVLEPDPTASDTEFADPATVPATTGSVLATAGNSVIVTNASDPGSGVRITVSGSGPNPSTFVICGLTVTMNAGSDATFTCGSLVVTVVSGIVTTGRDNGAVVVTLDAGDRARVAAPPTPFQVENLGTTPVAVTVGGTAYELAAGSTIPGPVATLVLSPLTSVTATRVAQTYTVHAVDASGLDLGDVTANATLTIAPNGSCTGATCSASVVGPHTVTARVGTKSTTASLDVRLAQTIKFSSLAARTMLQSPLTVAATSTSNLVVSFTTTTPDTCVAGGASGTTITLVAAGTCAIRADQAGNATYAPATAVLRTFTINKAAQTITFASVSAKTLAQSPVSLSATASSGEPVTLTSLSPDVCVVAGVDVRLIAGGSCSVRADQSGNDTYASAPPVTRTFAVSKVAQTITFATPTAKLITDTPVAVSATASSGLPVMFTTVTPAVCTADGQDGASITLLDAGTCTVRAAQDGDATYKAATAISRSFTVSKLAQTVTFATPPAKLLTDSPVTVAAAATSGLPVTFTSTTPAICTAGGTNGAVITLVSAGTCTLRAAQDGNETYKAATAVSRSFTVSKVAQTITFPSITAKPIGASPLAMTATASSGLPVLFITTTPTVCTAGGVNGSSITLLAPGTCTVSATQPGNNTYKAAATVNRSFRVS